MHELFQAVVAMTSAGRNGEYLYVPHRTQL